ncbi:hypothetical protein ACFX1X_031890 [Malus domestica]
MISTSTVTFHLFHITAPQQSIPVCRIAISSQMRHKIGSFAAIGDNPKYPSSQVSTGADTRSSHDRSPMEFSSWDVIFRNWAARIMVKTRFMMPLARHLSIKGSALSSWGRIRFKLQAWRKKDCH